MDVVGRPGADLRPPQQLLPSPGSSTGSDQGVARHTRQHLEESVNKSVSGSVSAPALPVPPASHLGWVSLESGNPDTTSVVTTIRLGGSIDSTLRGDLDAAADTAIMQGGRVIVDVSEVTAIGEFGLHFFATLLRRRPGTDAVNNPISVINVHGCTRQLLERTGLITLLSDPGASASRM